MSPKRNILAFVFAAALAAFNVGIALAETATITAVPNNFPELKKVPAHPGMTAIVDVTTGTATIMVLDASTIIADGKQYDIGNDQKLTLEIKHHAMVVTGTLILVNFDGTGRYITYRGDRTVDFAGKGTIDQNAYDEVGLFDAGQFTVTNWTSISAHNHTVVHTIDVRDVVGFEDADVTVTNCWIASGFSSIAMKTTACRYPQGNAVAVASTP
jgi:hypothetical protein